MKTYALRPDASGRRVRAAVAAALAVATIAMSSGFAPSSARADSLLLSDGRLITGEVEHGPGGYVIHTRSGVLKFGDADVEHWTKSATPEKPAITPPPASSAGTPAPSVTPAPASPLKPKDKARQERNIAALLTQGMDALAASDFKAARDAFLDVLSLDPNQARALEGAGLAYLRLEDAAKARAMLEKASAISGTAPSRSLAINASIVLMRNRNAMRAAKYLKDYLAAHNKEVDEMALNAMATALSQADRVATANRFFVECSTFYDAENAKLEATRPGMKRWGSEWLPADEAQKKIDAFKKKKGELDAAAQRLANASSRVASNKEAMSAAISANRFRRAPINISGYQAAISQGENDAEAAQKEYDKIAPTIEFPPFPKEIAVVPLDTDLPIAPGTAVAVATPGKGLGGVVSSPGRTSPASSIPEPDPSPSPSTPVTPPPPRRRTVVTYAAAFPVAPDLLVTDGKMVQAGSTITVQAADGLPMRAEIVKNDAASGVALLRIRGQRVAYLSLADGFTGGAVTCIGFPTVSIFDPAPEPINGSVALPKVPGEKWTVRLSHDPKRGGSPLLAGGKVVGVQLASRDTDLASVPAISAEEIRALLQSELSQPLPAATTDPKAATMQLTATREIGG